MTLKNVRNFIFIIAIITLFMVVSNLFTTNTLSNAVQAVLDLTTLQEVVFAVDQMNVALEEERIAVGQFQLSGDEELLTRMYVARDAYDEHWSVIMANRRDEQTELLSTIAANRETYLSLLDDVVSSYQSNPSNNDSASKLSVAITYFLQVLDPSISSFAEPEIENFASRVEVEKVVATNLQARETITSIVGLIISLAGVIMAFVYVLGTQRIVASITKIINAANSISRGDLDVAINVDQPGEIGELAKAIERMRTSLKAAIERLRR